MKPDRAALYETFGLLGLTLLGGYVLYRKVRENASSQPSSIAPGGTSANPSGSALPGPYVYASSVTAAGWQQATLGAAQNVYTFYSTHPDPCSASVTSVAFAALVLAFQAAFSADPKVAGDAGSSAIGIVNGGRFNLQTAQALALVLQLPEPPTPCSLA